MKKKKMAIFNHDAIIWWCVEETSLTKHPFIITALFIFTSMLKNKTKLC